MNAAPIAQPHQLLHRGARLCTVNLGRGARGRPGRVGGRHAREPSHPTRLPLSRRGHQPRRLAVLPLSAEPAMVEEMLAARGIDVSHETVRQWGRKFGQSRQPDPPQAPLSWRQVASRRSVPDDRRPEALALAGRRPGWGCARRSRPEPAGQEGRQAPAPQVAEAADAAPRVLITDKLASYGAAKGEVMPSVEHRRHKVATTERRTRTSRPDDGSGR